LQCRDRIDGILDNFYQWVHGNLAGLKD
jgi:hypothetical protein